jgi:excisionase family DNA binding protein
LDAITHSNDDMHSGVSFHGYSTLFPVGATAMRFHSLAIEGAGDPAISGLAKALASEVAALLKSELARISTGEVQPVLLDVKQAAVYLGRSEQSVQHLIFQKDLPVVRSGRRVHLHRRDLDAWIEKNTY